MTLYNKRKRNTVWDLFNFDYDYEMGDIGPMPKGVSTANDMFTFTKQILSKGRAVDDWDLYTYTDKETGEKTQCVYMNVPGCAPADVKVTFNKDTRVLTLTAKSAVKHQQLTKEYRYEIAVLSADLLEDTLSTTVENGIATVSGKLRDRKKEAEEQKKNSEVEIPVK